MSLSPPPAQGLASPREVHAPKKSPRRWLAAFFFAPWLVAASYQIARVFFLCDDSFISFRYARNLVEGHGLVFNVGEYVEGYTNMLWVLEVAALWGAFGLRPEISAPILSIGCTLGVFYLLALQAKRSGEQTSLVAWMATGLLACSSTFAVWSTSGLETRQFTLLILLGAHFLLRYRKNSRNLVLAGFSFAAAELTRPEGTLLFGCALAWFALELFLTKQRSFRKLIEFILPFVAVVSTHYLWRYAYYGEWLPNTYYAKHVRPWYESGFDYLVSATLETGAYAWIALTTVALIFRWRAPGGRERLLPFFLILPHAAYLLRIGGDHFEFRPLDFYWPLLAVPTAEGLMIVAQRFREFLCAYGVPQRYARVGPVLGLSFLVLLVYSTAIQASILHLSLQRKTRAETADMHVALSPENAGWIFRLPAMPAIVEISNAIRARTASHLVGSRAQEHRVFAKGLRRAFEPYENSPTGLFPANTVMAIPTIGVSPFYLRDVTVIDTLGLADAVVARTPVDNSNAMRKIAHDRRPPPGYLHRRGVNVYIHGAVETADAALSIANYGLKIDDDTWMPFDALDETWVRASFPQDRIAMRFKKDSLQASENQVRFGARAFVGRQIVESFEADRAARSWRVSGTMHVESFKEAASNQSLIFGRTGQRILSSWSATAADAGTGEATSPTFVAQTGDFLVFYVSGGASPGVGVALVADGKEVGVWRGQNNEAMLPVLVPLTVHAGQSLSLKVFDRSRDGWGHIAIDQIFLATEVPSPK